MRYYYEAEFIHIIDDHQAEIMDALKREYANDLFDSVRDFLDGGISEKDLVERIKEIIVESAELVYDDHE